ncbi:MAG: shikimate kinase [Acidobacteriota bacterium]
MRIYLVGFMGCGKSTVGRELASTLDWDFLDLDREIERRSGHTIPEIFEREGEAGFRLRETTALAETRHRVRTILATGGGAFTRQENVDLIRRSGVSVWLDPDFPTLVARLRKSVRKRPLFQSEEQLRELWQSRLPWYGKASLRIRITPEDHAVSVSGKIVERLKESPCAT